MKSKTIIQTFVAIFMIAMVSLTTACSFDLKGLFGGGSDGTKVDTPLRVDTVITFAGLPDYLDQQIGKSDLFFAISDPSNSKVSSIGGLIRNASQKIHLSFEPSEDFTKVPNEAFANCENLVEISLPKGVTILGSLSFYDCTKLEKVSLPNSLTNIMDGVFCLDSLLSDVEIPDNVIALGDSSFCCTAIRKVTIPDGVKRIEALTFGECKHLLDVKIPKSVSYIGPASFAITGIEKITLTAKTIDEYAFWFCKNLKTVNIENSVDEVGENAFCNAEIDKLNISSKIIGEEAFKSCKINKLVVNSSVKEIKDRAFLGCEGLKELVVPSTVDVIGVQSFSDSKFEKATISAKKVREMAFVSCNNLKEVTLEPSVEQVGSEAFYLCNNLRALSFDGKNDYLKNGIVDVYSNKMIIYVNDRYYYEYDRKYKGRYTFRTK